jgi:hypothetical protein
MKLWFAPVLLLLVAASPCWSADYSAVSTEKLVDELTALDQAAPGIDGRGTYEVFFAEDTSPLLAAGLLPVRKLTIPSPMRELVRRGLVALPVLLAHLDDARPTKITVGEDASDGFAIGGQFFNEEYDPRHRNVSAGSK